MSKEFISKTYQLVGQPYGREQVMHETVTNQNASWYGYSHILLFHLNIIYNSHENLIKSGLKRKYEAVTRIQRLQ